MSFYVTLPSNSSTRDYPENRQSNYTTSIINPITLDMPYEVALVDITYSPRISVEIGKLLVPNLFSTLNTLNHDSAFTVVYDRKKMLEVSSKCLNGQQSNEYFVGLNKEIKNQLLYEEYLFRHLLVTQTSEKQIQIFTEYYRKNKLDVKLYILQSDNLNRIIYSPTGDNDELDQVFLENGGTFDLSNCHYVFTQEQIDAFKVKATKINLKCPDTLNEQTPLIFQHYLKSGQDANNFDSGCMGEITTAVDDHLKNFRVPYFTYTTELVVNYKNTLVSTVSGLLSTLMGVEEISIAQTTPFVPNLSIICYAAIYCDLIEDQYVGDALAPILGLINMTANQSNETVTFYENPHYVNCRKSRINRINIQILDLEGNPIQFENIFSYVILKLHFRPKYE